MKISEYCFNWVASITDHPALASFSKVPVFTKTSNPQPTHPSRLNAFEEPRNPTEPRATSIPSSEEPKAEFHRLSSRVFVAW